MQLLAVHEFHHDLGAHFGEERGMEVVSHYCDPLTECAALRNTAGVLDLSFRGRFCLTGADRVRFLHGQVTNDVKSLSPGEGCYAALVTAKGKMQSDLNIYCLPDELLLDLEPGLGQAVAQRLEKYIIADDVQVVDAVPHYGLLSVQGPKADLVIRSLDLGMELPAKPMNFTRANDPTLGEIYLMNQPRIGTSGFDLFVPTAALSAVADKSIAAVNQVGGRACGWQALETARIEAGIPRFGADMDETNIPLEAGLENHAVSFTKGCYIGQEVIARIRTYGQVAKALRGLRLADDLKMLPAKGDKLFHGEKEVGYITSAVASPMYQATIALGYVRREHNQIGTELLLRLADVESCVQIVELPFNLKNA
jgi:folate-binding protein YgfZ